VLWTSQFERGIEGRLLSRRDVLSGAPLISGIGQQLVSTTWFRLARTETIKVTLASCSKAPIAQRVERQLLPCLEWFLCLLQQFCSRPDSQIPSERTSAPPSRTILCRRKIVGNSQRDPRLNDEGRRISMGPIRRAVARVTAQPSHVAAGL